MFKAATLNINTNHNNKVETLFSKSLWKNPFKDIMEYNIK